MKRNFYSQNGEDSILWALFAKRKTPGVFAEIGALDGTRFSNTYSFEEQGWTGLCVEAHPFYIDICKKNRPNSHVIHAAIGSENKKEITFYANKLGSLSTIDKENEKHYRKYGKAFYGFEEKKVPMRTMDSVLDEAGITELDIVSVDIEGAELQAMQGFTLEKYKPRVLVLEGLTKAHEQQLKVYMKKVGYFFCRRIANNLFFCRNKKDARKIHTAPQIKRKRLIHTDHPLKGKL